VGLAIKVSGGKISQNVKEGWGAKRLGAKRLGSQKGLRGLKKGWGKTCQRVKSVENCVGRGKTMSHK